MGESIHAATGVADDLLALVDELPSLFADPDEQQQQQEQQQHLLLMLDDGGNASHAEPMQQQPMLSPSIVPGGGLRLAPSSSAPSLSAEEISELLRDIDGGPGGAGESGGIGLMEQQLQPQRRALVPTQQPGASAKPNRKKSKGATHKSNKARDGRKEEILLLHKTVFELESRLDMLKKQSNDEETQELSNSNHIAGRRHNRRPAPRLLLAHNHNGRDPDAELQDAWREIARRQFDQRDASERENIRLRLVLESQLKVAKSLEKFLMLKAASTMELSRSVDVRHRHYYRIPRDSNLSNDPSDAEIFQELFTGIEQSLAEVDAVYEANGLARMETTQMSAQMRLDPATGMLVEVCAAKVLPFGVHETGEAVWGHCMFDKQSMPSRCYSYHSHKSTTGATEDTIIEDFALELHAKNTRASFRVRQVMRRVVEDERVVVVWRSFFDPTEFSEQQLSHIRFLEKGYVVIRKSSASSTSSSARASASPHRPGVTLLQPCYIIYPHSTTHGGDLTEESDSVVDAIADFMLSSTVTNVADSHQMVENMLLQEALRQQSRLVAPRALGDTFVVDV